MSQFLVLCLILADAFVLLATANERPQTNVASFPIIPPSPSPSNAGKKVTAEPPAIRKLGKHHTGVVNSSLNPSRAPESEAVSTRKEVSASDQETRFFQGQQVHLEKQHHSIDKSVAGGGVILGGLATTFLVAVFCYIRATGRKNAESDA